MNKRLNKLYQEINDNGIQAISHHNESIDQYLSAVKQDSRRGLTLLVPIPAHIRRNIMFCRQKLQMVEPSQYYYPTADLHITAIDLLAARLRFSLSSSITKKYCDQLKEIASSIGLIHWQMKGLAISPEAVLVKGYYSSNLTKLRNLIRRELPETGLDLEERYPTFAGHITIARFSHPVTANQQLLTIIDELSDIDLGNFTSSYLDLVVHDWYNHNSRLISPISLTGN